MTAVSSALGGHWAGLVSASVDCVSLIHVELALVLGRRNHLQMKPEQFECSKTPDDWQVSSLLASEATCGGWGLLAAPWAVVAVNATYSLIGHGGMDGWKCQFSTRPPRVL